MGEQAEMMMDGTLCEICGVLILEPNEDGSPVEPPGYPGRCGDCEPFDLQPQSKRTVKAKVERRGPAEFRYIHEDER